MRGTKNHKVLHALYCPTIRKLVDESNRLGIQRDDVLTILKEREQYVLIYYYGTAETNKE